MDSNESVEVCGKKVSELTREDFLSLYVPESSPGAGDARLLTADEVRAGIDMTSINMARRANEN